MHTRISDRLRALRQWQGGRRRELAIGVTGLAVAGLLTFHFVMTLFHLQPDNPFRDQVYSFVNGYMSPYFTQNWKLFAPAPEEPSKHLGVVCRFAEPGIADSEVFDVTAPHYDDLQRYRLSSSQRIIRAQLYPLTRVHPPKDLAVTAVEKLAQSAKAEERELAASLAALETRCREDGMQILARVASAECARRYPDARISEVQVLYFHERAPKFSQRNEPDAKGEVVSIDYGWRPYEAVATY